MSDLVHALDKIEHLTAHFEALWMSQLEEVAQCQRDHLGDSAYACPGHALEGGSRDPQTMTLSLCVADASKLSRILAIEALQALSEIP